MIAYDSVGPALKGPVPIIRTIAETHGILKFWGYLDQPLEFLHVLKTDPHLSDVTQSCDFAQFTQLKDMIYAQMWWKHF